MTRSRNVRPIVVAVAFLVVAVAVRAFYAGGFTVSTVVVVLTIVVVLCGVVIFDLRRR